MRGRPNHQTTKRSEHMRIPRALRAGSAGVGAVIAACLLIPLAPTAAADPINAKSSGTVTLGPCSNGFGPTTVVTNSGNAHPPNGVFSPAFDLSSTSVFVPSQFLAGTTTFTGPVDDTLTFPADPPKGNSQGAGGSPVTCPDSISNTFELTDPLTLPDGVVLTPGTYTVITNAAVIGFFPSQK
jgi:hypothetical protein